MGKKKVIKETKEEMLKSTEVLESKMAKQSGKGASKRIENGRAYIHASYNNTIITVTDDKGGVITWSSAGSLGFNGPKKATPFASSKVVAAIAEKTKKSGPTNLDIYVSGVGSGRDSALRSFANQGYTILSIHDLTPIPHNGPRAKKVRRV